VSNETSIKFFVIGTVFFSDPLTRIIFNYVLRLTQGEYVQTLSNTVKGVSEVLILKNTMLHSCQKKVNLSGDSVPSSFFVTLKDIVFS
jgi:hypothetical protein